MKGIKKYWAILVLLGSIALGLLGTYAYHQFGYKLTTNEIKQIAYQNAGIKSKDIKSQEFVKSRIGLAATYVVKLETNSKSYAYTINASSGSIIERHYKKK